MVYPENIDSGHSNFKLDNRSGCHHCNLAHLQLHALNRSGLDPAPTVFKTGHYESKPVPYVAGSSHKPAMNAAASCACSGEEMLSRCIPLTDAMSRTQNSSVPISGKSTVCYRSRGSKVYLGNER